MLEVNIQQVKDKRLRTFDYLIRKTFIKKIIYLTLEEASVKNLNRDCILTIRFTNSHEGKMLNTKYRNKKYATNVLTFSYETCPTVIADIVICLPVIYSECQRKKIGRLEHLAHMVVHGTLHALGYDHENPRDAQIMEKLEEKILELLGIDSPHIEKT